MGEGGEHFDLVVHLFHAFNPLDHVSGVAFQRRPRDLPHQGYLVAFDFVSDVVEDAEVGQHQDFVPDFLLNPLHGPRWNLFLCLRHQDEHCPRRKEYQACNDSAFHVYSSDAEMVFSHHFRFEISTVR